MTQSNAFTRFKKTHADAVKFVPAAKTFSVNSYRAHKCRLALVYGVASMDSYFTSKFTEKLTNFLKSKGITNDLEKFLSDAGINTHFFLDLLRDGDFTTKKETRPFKKIHTKMKDELGRFTSQSTSNIDSLFKAYGLKNLSECAFKKAKKQGLLFNIRKPEMRLKKMVQRRHEIVHQNDYNLRSEYRKIDVDETNKNLEIIYAFVLSADEIIENKFQKK